MGILDRIAGTLDELTGDTDAGAATEIMRAQALADAGDLDGADAALRAVTQAFPRYAPGFVAVGELAARRGRLDDAVNALGRAVDLDGDRADSWYALGDALARLGRTEPARDALRRALTLGLEPWFIARVQASLGRVHAHAGEWTAAARALRKAIDLAPPGEDDRGIALDYGRVLVKLGDREATEWLTRAARAPDARPPVYAEAAAATVDHERAEALLREGVARWPGDRSLRAALARRLARAARTADALALAEACAAEAPDDLEGLAALRDSYAAAERWTDAVRVAADEARLGAPPPLAVRVTLALGAHDLAALTALAEESGCVEEEAPLRQSLAAFAAGHASDADMLRMGRLAPGPAARAFLARGPTPPPPAGQLAGLLTWTYDLFSNAPPLVGLAAGPARRQPVRPAALRPRSGVAHAAAGTAGAVGDPRRRGLRSPAAGGGDGRVQRRQVVVCECAVRRGRRAHRRHAHDRDRERAPLRRRARGARRRSRRRHAPLARRGRRPLSLRPARRRGARDPDGGDLPAGGGPPPRGDRRHPGAELDPAGARTGDARLPPRG